MTGKANFGVATFLMLWTAASFASARPKECFPIRPAEIVAAIASTGVDVRSSQIEPLSPVLASRPTPKLKVVGLTPLDAQVVKVRLRCESSKVCLPFYVLLHSQQSDQRTALDAWLRSSSTSARPLRQEEILVRNGGAATMVFEGKHMRMTLPVVCLQNGGRGQRVRVMSKDRKRIYLARVEGDGTVRAGSGD